jgi:hypothetical protein
MCAEETRLVCAPRSKRQWGHGLESRTGNKTFTNIVWVMNNSYIVCCRTAVRKCGEAGKPAVVVDARIWRYHATDASVRLTPGSFITLERSTNKTLKKTWRTK